MHICGPYIDPTGPQNNTPPLNHRDPLNHTGTTSLKIFLNQMVLQALPYLCYTGRDADGFSETYKFYESNYDPLVRTDHIPKVFWSTYCPQASQSLNHTGSSSLAGSIDPLRLGHPGHPYITFMIWFNPYKKLRHSCLEELSRHCIIITSAYEDRRVQERNLKVL